MPLCSNCIVSGLPLLPVRYVPVPNSVKQTLPGWASGARIKNVALGSEYHYALRTLRSGYVYLFFEKNARGSNQWECYSVTEDGCLMKQPNPSMASEAGPTVRCATQGHSNARLHHLVIEKPEKCGPTWIAFSEHKWSDETVKEYTSNSQLRSARMQTIDPAAMAGGAKNEHSTPALASVLEEVIEYATDFSTSNLPHAANSGPFTKEDGSYEGARLSRVSTRYPWHQRQGGAAESAKHMQQRSLKDDGTNSTPHVLALWDAMGMTHELNGYRNDAAGWLKQYSDERDLQLSAVGAFDGIKTALESRAGKEADRQIAGNMGNVNATNAARRSSVVRNYFNQPETSGPEVAKLDKQLEQGLISEASYEARRTALVTQYVPANNQASAQADFAVLDRERRESTPRREASEAALKKGAIAQAWPKYRDRMDQAAYTKFVGKWDEFQDRLNPVIEARTKVLIAWLEAPLFLDSLHDFHGENVEDGVLFAEGVSEALFGMASSDSGKKKIEQWVKEAKATFKSNLLWRVVALNQNAARMELDAALAEAEQHKGQRTLASALAWTNYTVKTLKAFADCYKKLQGVSDANAKASAAAGSKAFGARLKPVNMRGVDKFAISVGDIVFKHFRVSGLADYASEKIIQHIFSIRGLVNPADSVNLIIQQSASENLLRQQTLRRVSSARTFMAADTPQIRSAQAESLQAAWADFKAHDARAPAAIKDARLAVVVALIEGVNFSKLLVECKTKGDMKTALSLLASGMSITSAMFDIATVPIKNLPQMGAETWTYQKLKLWGGVLSGGASLIASYLDFVDGGKNKDKGYFLLAGLYFSKGLLGLASGGLTLAVAFTYSAPLVGRLTGNAALSTAVRAVGTRAATFIGLRILGMAAGGWITLGIFGVQVIIWQVTPNALEEWIDHSAFGKERNNDGYRSSKEQDEKLGAALNEMGLQ